MLMSSKMLPRARARVDGLVLTNTMESMWRDEDYSFRQVQNVSVVELWTPSALSDRLMHSFYPTKSSLICPTTSTDCMH
jgi:hypothetical protein